ncbi:MAG: L-lysine 6-transaminase [Ignavibacteriales bacterium]|nr:L-lysine 6-transaminase [Ignavibacteriales bacterium]
MSDKIVAKIERAKPSLVSHPIPKIESTSSVDKPTTKNPVVVSPTEVHATLSKHMLIDGFDLIVDLKRSQGAYLYDSRYNKRYLDFFTFFASGTVGLNHPKLVAPDFLEKLGYAAVNKPSNSDAYTVEMAEFVETFARIAMPEYLPYAFFVDGGALANENALKTAFDWKVRKNFIKGYTEERGRQVIHFRKAFHGRSGYTLSLTNTDPVKTNYFPKFKWPRVHNPVITFPLNERSLWEVEKAESITLQQIKQAIINNPDDIAALIIEPIQGEGGDNHFRKEFFVELRTICDENEILLIFDEVQTGIGITGKMWAHQHFVRPDMMSFGKKTQICGFMSSKRIDDVLENVFHKPSRINSTFGGNLVDMIRFKRILEIVQEENLIENAKAVGEYVLQQLQNLQQEFPTLISNARGRGLFCAMDLDTAQNRDQLRIKAYDEGLILIGCGDRSIRFRPPLNIKREEMDEGIRIIRGALVEISAGD